MAEIQAEELPNNIENSKNGGADGPHIHPLNPGAASEEEDIIAVSSDWNHFLLPVEFDVY